MIELAIAMPIVLFAASMFLSTIVAAKRQRTVNRENAVVVDTLRAVAESMRNEDFDQIVAMYNEEPLDDPNGPGTAPGHRFAVRGIKPLEESPDGMTGEVVLPMMNVSEGPLPQWELREDMQDERLGMPRDLDGDHVIDDQDHSGNYRILPVVIEAEWQGLLGARRLRVFTLLMEYRS